MVLYPPLKFVEQMESYFQVSDLKNMQGVVNAKAIKFAEDYLATNRGSLYHNYGTIRNLGNLSKEEEDKCKNDLSKFCKVIGLRSFELLDDFFDLMIYNDIRSIWRKNKLAYLLDTSLFYTFLDMKTPDLAPMECLVKLPANCFYVDYNGNGSELMTGLEGTFISTDKFNDELNIVLLHLVHSNKLGRKLLVTSVLRLSDTDESKFSTALVKAAGVVPIECEDGVTRNIDENKMWRCILNFLIYLHASNRDVEISERTRKNHEKTKMTIKNKFCEVKEFNVGISYGRTISKDTKRIKYIDAIKQNISRGSSRSSHYRSAHWHHYWTGSGDDKKLIIKWIEGVFVKGSKDEAENIVVHKVK